MKLKLNDIFVRTIEKLVGFPANGYFYEKCKISNCVFHKPFQEISHFSQKNWAKGSGKDAKFRGKMLETKILQKIWEDFENFSYFAEKSFAKYAKFCETFFPLRWKPYNN